MRDEFANLLRRLQIYDELQTKEEVIHMHYFNL